jgi:DNA sulfur modification protein DndB
MEFADFQRGMEVAGAYTYTFPTIRGIQAGREYYVSMCPLRLTTKMFIFDDEELRPELRAQRVLNKARIPPIASYIVNNPTEYVFSAISASIDAEVEFKPISPDPAHYNIGTLIIPMAARLVVNDGQHRRAAIEAALKERPELGDETIATVFFIDAGLERSQQMFADLNRYAIRPTQSLNILYDHRDPSSKLARDLTRSVSIFSGLTETDKSTISNRSTKLFTLSAIHRATVELLKDYQESSPVRHQKIASEYWNEVAKHIPEWQMVKTKDAAPANLRKDYIHAHAVALVALGRAGRCLLAAHPRDWEQQLAT